MSSIIVQSNCKKMLKTLELRQAINKINLPQDISTKVVIEVEIGPTAQLP